MAFLEGYIDIEETAHAVALIGEQIVPGSLLISQSDERNTLYAVALNGEGQVGTIALPAGTQVALSLTVESTIEGPPEAEFTINPQAIYVTNGVTVPTSTGPILVVSGGTSLQPNWTGYSSWVEQAVANLAHTVDPTQVGVFFEISGSLFWNAFLLPPYVNLNITDCYLTVTYYNGAVVQKRPTSWTMVSGNRDTVSYNGSSWNIECRKTSGLTTAGWLGLFTMTEATEQLTEDLSFHLGGHPIGSIYPDEGVHFSGTTETTGSIYPRKITMRWIQDSAAMGIGIAR